ncbi:MAG: glycoside hydrolase family 5 protein [bacterium]|nr:glycoside hydrolase family 5 protein [bacterium]
MKRRILAVLLCCTLTAGVLAGCGLRHGESADIQESTESTDASDSGTDGMIDTEDADRAESANAVGDADRADNADETEDTGNNVNEEDAENMGNASAEKTPTIPDIEITMQDISPMDLVGEMKIGWNLGNTLDAVSSQKGPETETAWGNPVTTQEMIDAVIDQGFNVIRIPITWESHMGDAPDYEVWPAWMDRVQEVVDYAYGRGVYVIINIHHEEWHFPSEENKDAASSQLKALWTAIAERFRDYDEHLLFEGMNEPRKKGTSVEWNGGDKEGQDVVNYYNQVFVDAVRATGGNNTIRNLMVPGYAASADDGALRAIVLPEDEHLIVSVHAYTPYDFALNTAGKSTWDNDTAGIAHLLALVNELFIRKGVPVIIGEFGAMNKDNEEERVQWAEYYVSKAREYGVPCIWWDNNAFDGDGETFGLFDRRKLTFPYPDLLRALLESAE